MADRYRVWLGAGFLAGGMSAAMLTGAGVAAADDGASAGSESRSAADSKESGETDRAASGPDSATSSVGSDKPGKDRKGDDAGQDAESEPDSEDVQIDGEEAGSDDVADDNTRDGEVLDGGADGADDELPDPETHDGDSPEESGGSGEDNADQDGQDDQDDQVEAEPDPGAAADPQAPADNAEVPAGAGTAAPQAPEGPAAGTTPAPDSTSVEPVGDQADVPADESSPAAEPGETVVGDAAAVFTPEPSSFVTGVDTDLSATDAAVVMRTAAALSPWLQAVQDFTEMLDNLGTAVYNLYTGTMQFLAGPVRAPLGSNVRVESSTLRIGDVEVTADWYFPDTDEPVGIIYFQHGFLATSAFYSATAAYLAEKTRSVVVAPTLTWNIFDFDGYPLMLSRTHRAVAKLFTGDRAALTASAREAGFTGELPSRLVLAGHSAGGGMVVGTARHLVDFGAAEDLGGVIMLDGVGHMDQLSADLAKLPADLPVYNLAGEPYLWNNFGKSSEDLADARPGAFTGVVVDGGKHADAMQSSSPLIQFVSNVATGIPTPWNVAGTEMLAAGWIKDMLYSSYTPRLYGEPGSMLNILTGWWVLSSAQVYPVVHNYIGPLDVLFTCLLNPGTVECTYVTPGYFRRASTATGRVA